LNTVSPDDIRHAEELRQRIAPFRPHMHTLPPAARGFLNV
jgi:hypothetical protein